jgi:hypothetical protein
MDRVHETLAQIASVALPIALLASVFAFLVFLDRYGINSIASLLFGLERLPDSIPD